MHLLLHKPLLRLTPALAQLTSLARTNAALGEAHLNLPAQDPRAALLALSHGKTQLSHEQLLSLPQREAYSNAQLALWLRWVNSQQIVSDLAPKVVDQLLKDEQLRPVVLGETYRCSSVTQGQLDQLKSRTQKGPLSLGCWNSLFFFNFLQLNKTTRRELHKALFLDADLQSKLDCCLMILLRNEYDELLFRHIYQFVLDEAVKEGDNARESIGFIQQLVPDQPSLADETFRRLLGRIRQLSGENEPFLKEGRSGSVKELSEVLRRRGVNHTVMQGQNKHLIHLRKQNKYLYGVGPGQELTLPDGSVRLKLQAEGVRGVGRRRGLAVDVVSKGGIERYIDGLDGAI